MVLNDYADRIYDKRDVESRMTGYWHPFGTRPIAEGLIPARDARNVVLLLAVAAFVLILTLPYPHSLFVALIMGYSYAVEVFYQVKKRSQTFPVAGYLAVGMPDGTALLYFLFFYPYALAHLAANDIADLRNDIVRGMKTVPVLYGVRGTIIWIVACTVLHGIMAFLFCPCPGSGGSGGAICCIFAGNRGDRHTITKQRDAGGRVAGTTALSCRNGGLCRGHCSRVFCLSGPPASTEG